MGIVDVMMGKNRMDVLEDSGKKVLSEIEKFEKITEEKKRKKLDLELRKRLIKFFRGLNKLGVEVYLDKKHGGRQIKKLEDLEEIELKEIYRRYVLKTLKEIRKEIDRRIKEDES